MNQPPQTGKRIVSKGEYVKAQGKRVSLTLSAICLYLAAAACGMCATGLLLGILGSLVSLDADLWGAVLYRGMGVLFFGGATYFLGKMALAALEQTDDMDSVIPLTRANTADLPAPDSLVRASAEPTQEQENVLLRAATQAQKRHEEQLVRASTGGTEQR